MKNIASITICLLVVLLIFSCKEEELSLGTGNSIVDQYGRVLVLHGLNTSSSAKSEPERQPWIVESDVENEATNLGFNFVRYLIFWDGVEPEKGEYNEAYLDKVEERVNWYTSRGMYVMLDMHQDLYSIVFGGDGAPEWAIKTNGHPLDVDIEGPWWLQNINPAVIAAWTNFWSYSEGNKFLQDHYIAMWQKVVNRFKDNEYVIGYDLMNEPWGGDLIKAFITGDFERKQLSAFYSRLIPAIREVDPFKYIFFEPVPAPVTFGLPSQLKKISNITSNTSNLVYAPHCYPLDVHEGIGYTSASKTNLRDWERERKIDVEKHGDIPLVVGEFGVSPNMEGFDDFLTDALIMYDRNLWHWAYWSSDPGGWGPWNGLDRIESPIMNHLVRTYARAIAGVPINFSF